MSVAPVSLNLTEGESRQLLVTGLAADGSTLSGALGLTFRSTSAAVASVSATGLVTAITTGSAAIEVTATVRDVTRGATVSVQVAARNVPAGRFVVDMAGTTFLPASLTIPAGDSVTWRFSGATHNVTFGAVAPTGGSIPDQVPGNAVTRIFPSPGIFAYECTRHAGMTGQVIVQGSAPVIFASLRVTPNAPAIPVGSTLQLTAVPLDQSGTPIAGLPAPEWTTSDPLKATVNSSGVVTTISAGVVAISAVITSQGVAHSAAALVTITSGGPSPNTITTPSNTFSPALLTIQAGDTVTWQFSGAVHNVTWLLAQPPAGNIVDQQPGNSQRLAFPTPGSFDYECTRHAGMIGRIVVQGSNPPVFSSVRLTPSTPSLAVGQTVSLTATPLDQTGTPMTGLPAAGWAVSDPTKASVANGGVVTAIASGVVTVTASITSGGVTRSAAALVTITAAGPSPNTITTPSNTFSPALLTIQAGDTVTWQFSGAVHNVTWLLAQPPAGNIVDQQPGNSQRLVFPTPGSFDYECTRHAGMTGRIVVQGSSPAVFTSVQLSPSASSMAVGQSVSLTATPLDQFGIAMTGLPSATWNSSAAGVATVTATGSVIGVGPGTATVTATIVSGGVTHAGTATVTVSAPQPGSVTVTTPSNSFSPRTVTISAGGTVQWQISGTTHNVTFSGSAPTGGNIPDTAPGNTVSRTFPTAGTYSYECTRHGGMTGQVTVQSTGGTGTPGAPPGFTSLSVTPSTGLVARGSFIQLAAQGLDQNGQAMAGLPAPTWSSSDPTKAVVSATGAVTGVSVGTVSITASVTSGGVTKTATATVGVSSNALASALVTMSGQKFSPEDVEILRGGTVTWQFSSSHNVTFADSKPEAGDIPDTSSGSVSRTFLSSGDYDYVCSIHKGMKGRVRVR